MLKIALEGASWTLRAVGDLSAVPPRVRDALVPASVPGTAHTALMAAGLIEDPYVGLNERDVQWVGLTDWEYRCTFDAPAELLKHERIDLACDGLDTVAEVFVNGTKVGESESMHVAYRFDLRGAIRAGTNELAIRFASPVKYAKAQEARLGALPFLNDVAGPFNFIRKNACNFGWDWGPKLATCGIWRGMRVEGWSGVRIAAVRTHARRTRREDFDQLNAMPSGPTGFNWVLDKTWHADDPVMALEVTVEIEGTDARRYEIYDGTTRLKSSVKLDLLHPRGEAIAAQPRASAGDRLNRYVLFVPYPQLWWPTGHGEQPLYTLTVTLDTGEHWSGRIGLRTVELDTSPDDVGRKFVIKVNGKPIWCKGFNWIPDDCFLDRACTPERYRARLQQAIDANANMLRVWGGGIYETDAFYDLCDQMGILVWQDCLFACAAYPEEEPFRSLVEQELRHNVSRLARHASLVLWNGCNENLWGFYVWGQFKPLHDGTRTWGAGYYFDLIPRVLRELDPSRPYWPASPFSGEWVDAAVGTPMPPLQDPCSTSFPPVPLAAGDQTTGAGKKPVLRPRRWDVDACAFVDGPLEALTGVSSDPLAKERTPTGLHPNAASHGNKHVWEVWDAPYEVYRKFAPRFCSEFGFQAPATYATIARVTPPDQRRLDSDVMLQHQKSPTWLVSTAKRVKEVFGDGIDDFDDQHYLLQVNQARALQLGVEWFRTRRECSGTLYWQLNDCWPVTSWAAVDGDGRPKPLWYATRRFYAGRLLTIQPTGYDAPPGDPLTLFAVNDTDEPWAGEAAVTLYDMTTGAAVGVPFTTALSAGPRATASVTIALPQPADPSRQVLVANVGPHRAFWYFGPDKQLAYPAPRVEAQLQRRGDEHVLTLTAETFVRDLCVFADRLDPDAVVSDQLLTLLPGETRTLNITSARDLTLAGLTSRPVLRTVNDFGRRG